MPGGYDAAGRGERPCCWQWPGRANSAAAARGGQNGYSGQNGYDAANGYGAADSHGGQAALPRAERQWRRGRPQRPGRLRRLTGRTATGVRERAIIRERLAGQRPGFWLRRRQRPRPWAAAAAAGPAGPKAAGGGTGPGGRCSALRCGLRRRVHHRRRDRSSCCLLGDTQIPTAISETPPSSSPRPSISATARPRWAPSTRTDRAAAHLRPDPACSRTP